MVILGVSPNLIGKERRAPHAQALSVGGVMMCGTQSVHRMFFSNLVIVVVVPMFSPMFVCLNSRKKNGHFRGLT